MTIGKMKKGKNEKMENQISDPMFSKGKQMFSGREKRKIKKIEEMNK